MKKAYSRKISLLLFFLLPFAVLLSQPSNYWSNSFNSEASLLGGAVVGGGSGITSIYYNPANISEIENSNISLNSSLFKFTYETYNHAFGKSMDVSNSVFKIEPRFASFVFRPKKHKKISWQMAVFSHDYNRLYIYNTYTESSKALNLSETGQYSGSFNLNSIYDDYWAGFGAAYQVNKKFYVGFSILGSLKNMRYVDRIQTVQNPNAEQNTLLEQQQSVSSWSSFSWVDLWDMRILLKLGLRYKIENTSIGFNLTIPSIKIAGYGHTKFEQEYTDIINDDGQNIPDYYIMEYADYVYCQIRDPFSIALGITHLSLNKKNQYYFSTEYFAGINPYKMLDPTRGYSLFFNPVTASSRSTVYYGNRKIVNFGLGYMRNVRPEFELILGFKTDFNSSYFSGLSGVQPIITIYRQYANANLYHLSGGANFIFLDKLKINAGLELTYGRSVNNRRFVNFTDVRWYNPDNNTALQGPVVYDMSYNTINLGFFFGFVYIF